MYNFYKYLKNILFYYDFLLYLHLYLYFIISKREKNMYYIYNCKKKIFFILHFSYCVLISFIYYYIYKKLHLLLTLYLHKQNLTIRSAWWPRASVKVEHLRVFLSLAN